MLAAARKKRKEAEELAPVIHEGNRDALLASGGWRGSPWGAGGREAMRSRQKGGKGCCIGFGRGCRERRAMHVGGGDPRPLGHVLDPHREVEGKDICIAGFRWAFTGDLGFPG